MVAVILEPPARVASRPDDTLVNELLHMELAQLREIPDWEGLMLAGVTPALVVGGERRTRPR